jgi:hypothetical protein
MKIKHVQKGAKTTDTNKASDVMKGADEAAAVTLNYDKVRTQAFCR